MSSSNNLKDSRIKTCLNYRIGVISEVAEIIVDFGITHIRFLYNFIFQNCRNRRHTFLVYDFHPDKLMVEYICSKY